MRKVLVGTLVLVSAVGVSACGDGDKTKGKTPAAQTAAPVADVAFAKPVETKPSGPSDTVKGSGLDEPKTRFTLVLGEDKGGFKFRSTKLSDDAKAKIDEMFADEHIDFVNARFEIEGYTDSLGSTEVNKQYGLARAKAVKQYLDERYEIPGDRIKVVSFGMDKPVGDNSTPEGRAQNRRVVVKVVD